VGWCVDHYSTPVVVVSPLFGNQKGGFDATDCPEVSSDFPQVDMLFCGITRPLSLPCGITRLVHHYRPCTLCVIRGPSHHSTPALAGGGVHDRESKRAGQPPAGGGQAEGFARAPPRRRGPLIRFRPHLLGFLSLPRSLSLALSLSISLSLSLARARALLPEGGQAEGFARPPPCRRGPLIRYASEASLAIWSACPADALSPSLSLYLSLFRSLSLSISLSLSLSLYWRRAS